MPMGSQRECAPTIIPSTQVESARFEKMAKILLGDAGIGRAFWSGEASQAVTQSEKRETEKDRGCREWRREGNQRVMKCSFVIENMKVAKVAWETRLMLMSFIKT